MMKVELEYSSFFKPKQHAPELDALLQYCVASKLSLRLSLNPTFAVVSAHSIERVDNALSVTGRWRSPLLEADYQSPGTLLLAPFIFLIEGLEFPHGSLYSLGRSNRSIADFFMRNYFYSACRKQRINFSAVCKPSHDAVAKASRDLTRTYLWIVKSYLRDGVFERSNASELILASGHLELLEFSTPLVASGAADFRRIAAQGATLDHYSEQKRAFITARKRMLETYKN